ncbi:hypothetical protein [Streptomyces sp. NPDC059597]|uniref:hypothetical protein n=1 Tax=Streptomyces sp. NPDC059597 TaxID=3346879 RepID=UPI0036C69F4A
MTPGKTHCWLAQAIDCAGQWSGSGPLDSGETRNTLGPGKISVIAGGTNPTDMTEFQWSLNHPIHDKKAVPVPALASTAPATVSRCPGRRRHG